MNRIIDNWPIFILLTALLIVCLAFVIAFLDVKKDIENDDNLDSGIW